MTDDFKEYANNIIENTKACCEKFKELGAIVSDTDNHLFLLNVLNTYNITGKEAQKKLEQINITTNKNMIPSDTLSPRETSGLRIGFAAVTTRGCTKKQAEEIAIIIDGHLKNIISLEKAKDKVNEIVRTWKNIEEI